MRKGFLIYEEMCKYLTIYEEAVSHIWLSNCSVLNFFIYEKNLIFFFISEIHTAYCSSTSPNLHPASVKIPYPVQVQAGNLCKGSPSLSSGNDSLCLGHPHLFLCRGSQFQGPSCLYSEQAASKRTPACYPGPPLLTAFLLIVYFVSLSVFSKSECMCNPDCTEYFVLDNVFCTFNCICAMPMFPNSHSIRAFFLGVYTELSV